MHARMHARTFARIHSLTHSLTHSHTHPTYTLNKCPPHLCIHILTLEIITESTARNFFFHGDCDKSTRIVNFVLIIIKARTRAFVCVLDKYFVCVCLWGGGGSECARAQSRTGTFNFLHLLRKYVKEILHCNIYWLLEMPSQNASVCTTHNKAVLHVLFSVECTTYKQQGRLAVHKVLERLPTPHE